MINLFYLHLRKLIQIDLIKKVIISQLIIIELIINCNFHFDICLIYILLSFISLYKQSDNLIIYLI